MSTPPSYRDIPALLKEIRAGDTIYLISDILRLAKRAMAQKERFDGNLFLDALQEKLSPEGSLFIPVFNWDFCHGKAFDIRNSPSQTGSLGNLALCRSDFVRTRHPLYSFMVWGKHTDRARALQNQNSFGEGSVFDLLYQLRAKALVVDLFACQGLSFIHHVEQMTGVPYRYVKHFHGTYIDEEGVESFRDYTMYVRDLEKDPQEKLPLETLSNILETLSVSRTQLIDDIPFRTVDLVEAFPIIRADIVCNDSRNLYSYHGQRTD